MIKKVYQRNVKDCGVACLLSIIRYYKGDNTYENIRYLTKCSNNGVTALNLIEASKKLGFNARGLKCNYDMLKDLNKPLICHVVLENGYNHYIVLYKVDSKEILVFDPYYGIKKYNKEYFIKIWDNICIELIPYKKLDIIHESGYKKILKMLLKYKITYAFILILSLLSIVFTLLSNIYFKALIDGYNTLNILIYFIVLIIIKELTNYIKNRKVINLKNKVDKELVINTHKNALSLPNYYYSSRSSGDIVTKFNDLEYIRDFVLEFPIFMVIDILLMIITSVILININIKLSLIFFILCFIYFLILVIFDKEIKKRIEIKQEGNSIKNSILIENINSIETIKNMNLKEYRHNIFNNVFNMYLNNNVSYEYLYNKINTIKNIILYVGINIVLFEGIKLVNNNSILLSDLILFDSLMIYFIEPLRNICDLSPILKNGINALKRVSELYICNSKTFKDINAYNIEFDNLNFSYDGYKNIFNNFNYKIEENTKLLVVGVSGSGKSTLFKLLNKYYEVPRNMIKVGNVDINDINISKYITYISQEERLFNDTIYNNIVLDNSDKDISNVLKITLLDKILINKNITINEIIEEEGINFSKGEKQKIILARSLLKKSKILVLDEALSGVDEEDEYKIIKNILENHNDKTIIYISHSKVCNSLFNKKLNFEKGGILWN